MWILLAMIGATLVLDGLLLRYLTWAHAAERYAAGRFPDARPSRATRGRTLRLHGATMGLSLTLIVGAAVALQGRLFVDGPVAWWWPPLHALAILAVYDLAYYALHRFVFHHKKLMRYVHRTHHEKRSPSAPDSLFVHPVETILGVATLLGATALLGPVHEITFGLVFLAYSPMNLVNHMGMTFPRGHPLALFNGLATAHHGHHRLDVNKNFATLTTLYDRAFGTNL
ncbi:MAG: sterol desaturase family protein [Alphaproteobacteria bacterium]|nr:sterol desaturase family protein [Alphaproteobacteria bacterium]